MDSTGFDSKRPYGARTVRSDDGRHWPTTACPLMLAGTAEAEILSGLLRQLSH